MDSHPDTPPRIANDQLELAIITLLLAPDSPTIWTEHELARELQDPLATTDALTCLQAAGIIHRHNEYVFLTRTTARLHQLSLL